MAKDQDYFNELIKSMQIDAYLPEIDLRLQDLNSKDIALLLEQLARPNLKIEYIDLSFNTIDDEQVQLFAKILKTNNFLIGVDLSATTIIANGALAIAKALAENESIQYFDISANAIVDEGANAFAAVLSKNKVLRALRLYNCKISSQGMDYIARAAVHNNTLQSLDLSANMVDDNAIVAIASVLQENNFLREFYLSGMHLGFFSNGLRLIAAGLANNKALQLLDLSFNCIGYGGSFIAAALIKNKKLLELNLSLNQLDDDNAEAIAIALTKNKSLQVLNLSTNNIGDCGVQNIANAIPKNDGLYFLDLSDNSIDDSGSFALEEATKQRLKNQSKVSKLGWYVFCCAARNYKVVKKESISPGMYFAFEAHLKKSGASHVDLDKLIDRNMKYFVDSKVADATIGKGNSELKYCSGFRGVGNSSISLPTKILEQDILPYLKPKILAIKLENW